MGNYNFQQKCIGRMRFSKTLAKIKQAMDFGKNVIPSLLQEGKSIYVYDFNSNKFPGINDSEKAIGAM